jgi:hypothetical protein
MEETTRPEENPTATTQTSDGAKGVVPPGSLDLLCRLFPEKKRSVLELVLRRCEHDLLKAIEHCVPLCKTLTTAPKSRKSSTGKYLINKMLNQQQREVNFKLTLFFL